MRISASKFILPLALTLPLLLGACGTTYMGQQDSVGGLVTGALIGGLAGGPRGAIIGGAAGAAVGGVVGDSIERSGPRYAPPPAGYYVPAQPPAVYYEPNPALEYYETPYAPAIVLPYGCTWMQTGWYDHRRYYHRGWVRGCR